MRFRKACKQHENNTTYLISLINSSNWPNSFEKSVNFDSYEIAFCFNELLYTCLEKFKKAQNGSKVTKSISKYRSVTNQNPTLGS